MPLSGAATFTLVVVQAIWVWNELLIALVFLQNESARTLMAGLTQLLGRDETVVVVAHYHRRQHARTCCGE